MTRQVPAALRGRACAASCRHRGFSLELGDQATSSHPLAMRVAAARVARRGRQRVTRHVSVVWRRGIWFVQDVDHTTAVPW